MHKYKAVLFQFHICLPFRFISVCYTHVLNSVKTGNKFFIFFYVQIPKQSHERNSANTKTILLMQFLLFCDNRIICKLCA
jgi:hypothetical protein